MLKATAALLIVLAIFAIVCCAFSVLLKFVINAIERDQEENMEELVKQIDELFEKKKSFIERKEQYNAYKQVLHEFAAKRFNEELLSSFLGELYALNIELFDDDLLNEIYNLSLKHLNSLKKFED